LGRVLSALDLRERCRVVPLISKRILRILRGNLPQPKEWIIKPREAVTVSAVKGFQMVAKHVQRVAIHMGLPADSGYTDMSFIPQLLCAAATSAPTLQKLEIGALLYCESLVSVMHSLALLVHIQELHLELWDLTGVQQLSGLQSLQVLGLGIFLEGNMQEAADALWCSLATLGSLTQLSTSLITPDPMYSAIQLEVAFYASITLLTHLRVLNMLGIPGQCVDGNLEFLPCFGTLHRLTELACEIPSIALKSLPRLSLTKLSVELESDPPYHGPCLAPLTTEMLTSLSISYGSFKLEEIFSQTMAVLPRLRHLKIANSRGFHDLPDAVACSLTNLTSLDLTEIKLRLLPRGISLITSLHKFNAGGNEFSLEHSDIVILAALPKLQVLSLQYNKCSDGFDFALAIGMESNQAWSGRDAGVLLSIGRRFPNLTVKL